MPKDGELFKYQDTSFYDVQSVQHIYSDLFQKLDFPKEYPAFIQIHLEQPAQDVPLHWHPGSELIYSRNREVSVTIDGEKYLLKPGDFVLISSYALHAMIPTPSKERQDVMSISFQVSYLERMWPNIRELVIDRNAPGVTEASVENMRHLCEQLRMQVEREGDTRHFTTNEMLFAILKMMYSDFLVGERKEPHNRRESRNKLVDVLNYLETNYRSNLTTQSVADHFGYTREYFCRLFKRYSNQTFKQYLTGLRLAAAVKDLRITDRSAGQIGMECGFPDEKSFFTAFKKKYGVTPSQYRSGL